MPNRTIYLNVVKDIEKNTSLGNQMDLEKRLQEAWERDESEEKSDFLAEYRNIFQVVLKAWTGNEVARVLRSLSGEKPKFQQCLLAVDESLKLCAMALLPKLRDNEDILSNMTFGVMEKSKLKGELVSARGAVASPRTAEKEMKARQAEAYSRYKDSWKKTPAQDIADLVKNEGKLRSMSEKEKTDCALAINFYCNDQSLETPLKEDEKRLLSAAVAEWKKVLGCPNDESLEEFVGAQYFNHAQKIADDEWLMKEINGAIAEYNKHPNPSKQEIEKYKELEQKTAQSKKESERKQYSTNITDDMSVMVGDFFMREELTQELAEETLRKERKMLTEKLAETNKKYLMRISGEKLRTSIEQISSLMVKAREEKEKFLSKDSVIVIENGEEKVYSVQEYYKTDIEESNKKYLEIVNQVEAERENIKHKYDKVLQTTDKTENELGKEMAESLRQGAERVYKEESAALDRELASANRGLREQQEAYQGGIVVEKNGDTIKRYKSSEYYETRETQKEQTAYSEYQKMFAKVFEDACKNAREKDYLKGKITDYASIAKDVDSLFKTAMYVAGVYENPKNKEFVQKCSFGGFSTEQLAESVANIKGDLWSENQSSEQAWTHQKAEAKRIVAEWVDAEKTNPKAKSGELIQETLEKRRQEYKKGLISKKEMFDYMIAAEAHLQKRSAVFSITSTGKRAMAELNLCRLVTGLKSNDSLRVAMNTEYAKMANSLYKEKIFRTIQDSVGTLHNFETEKDMLNKKHQEVKEGIRAEKQKMLDKLRAEDREPISIPALDERKTILHQKPRVQQIKPPAQMQKNLNLEQ